MTANTHGITRHFDELGRVVIPIELRKALGFGAREQVEIQRVGKTLVLRKPADPCGACGGTGTA